MCSRYFLDADGNIIAYTFRVPQNPRVQRRFNIAPTQEAPVVRLDTDGARELALLRWGLVPSWAKELAVGNKMINARAEGVAEKPAFREALRKRRCLVPATGFYEWQGPPGRKQPFAVTVPEAPLFAFAGLWESWRPAGGEPVQTFTVITTDANPTVSAIHDRMPVILSPAQADAWLSGTIDEARALLKPFDGEVRLRAVTRRMSDPRAEGPQCLDDAEPTWGSQQSLL
jgi:putative SOS response-associated peptidase YedK